MKFSLKTQAKDHVCPIEIILMGGLGNQLFQIANGISLALKYQRALTFDVNWYKTNEDFSSCLPLFGLEPKVNYSIDIRNSEIQFRDTDQICNCPNSKYIEKVFCYSEISIDDRKFKVQGYFQSERYFEDYTEQIKLFFNSKLRPKYENQLVVHIRLGDMFLDKKINEVHGTLPVAYYIKAIQLQKEFFDEISIVTDSPDLVNEIYLPSISTNFSDKKIRIITGESPIEAFEVLKCAKNIIASNSTFSWWAAYLSDSNFIIAPRQLFQQKQLRIFNICDHYPPNWILI